MTNQPIHAFHQNISGAVQVMVTQRGSRWMAQWSKATGAFAVLNGRVGLFDTQQEATRTPSPAFIAEFTGREPDNAHKEAEFEVRLDAAKRLSESLSEALGDLFEHYKFINPQGRKSA